MITTRLTPADFRRQALILLRQCWKLLLIAVLLMSVFNWAGEAVESHGKSKSQAAYDAHMAAFYAENPRPEDEEEFIIWTYFDEDFAQYEAEDVYKKAYLPYRLASLAATTLDQLFGGVILVGLYAGLLMHLRTGECTLHCLGMGFSRWKRASWLAFRVLLNSLGWTLLALIPAEMLSSLMAGLELEAVGTMLGTVIVVCVALWAEIHYALAFVHMAEDTEDQFAVKDYLHDAVDNMNFFTVRGLLRCSWPVWVLTALECLLILSADWLSVPSMLVTSVCVACEIFRMMLLCAVYACVYEELRSRRMSAGISPASVEI